MPLHPVISTGAPAPAGAEWRNPIGAVPTPQGRACGRPPSPAGFLRYAADAAPVEMTGGSLRSVEMACPERSGRDGRGRSPGTIPNRGRRSRSRYFCDKILSCAQSDSGLPAGTAPGAGRNGERGGGGNALKNSDISRRGAARAVGGGKKPQYAVFFRKTDRSVQSGRNGRPGARLMTFHDTS